MLVLIYLTLEKKFRRRRNQKQRKQLKPNDKQGTKKGTIKDT